MAATEERSYIWVLALIGRIDIAPLNGLTRDRQ
jgi:hypothetical protein